MNPISELELKQAFMELTECDEKEADRFFPILKITEKSIRKRIRPNLNLCEIEEDLKYLVASIAAEQWILSKEQGNIKIGDLSFSKSEKIMQFHSLVELLYAACSEYLGDENFIFKSLKESK